MDLKTQLEIVAKNRQASIPNLKNKFDRLADKQSGRPSGSLPNNTQPNPRGGNSKAYQPPHARNEHVNVVFTRSAVRINVPLVDVLARMPNYGKFLKELISNKIEQTSAAFLSDKSSAMIQNKVSPKLGDPGSFLIPYEGSKILHFIEGTLLEEEIFSKFDEFMAMVADENFESESDTEEPPFEKITINTDYKIKTSLKEPPTDLKLKPLHDNLEYVFLEEPSFLPDAKKPVVQKQRRLNPNMQEVVKKEIVKLLDIGIIYPITDSPWVSPIHCVPQKGGIIVVKNENDELVLTTTITGWRVCIDYRKLNESTAKDHFPLPFMDQMLERLIGNKYFCFLDGFSGYFQIYIVHVDQEKTTFTCPFRTYAYRRMPFGLCNAPATFQRCMLAIFHDMIEESVEVFMDDFSVFGDSFDKCLNNLDKMLQRCKDAHLVLNWEKCHFMVKKGIVLGHKVFSAGLEVDKVKIDVTQNFHPLLISKVSYLILSKTIIHTNHSALKHLFKKQDAKPCFIHWILLLQEFDIEIKDRKGLENFAADHLSRIGNDDSSDDSEVDDNFPGETLMKINTKNEP
ncbi:reverse transcriptase domain-containing protein [Tanacetum coccineum]|uniref:Reverse transcriptase domain-containing protein n=1 Tax=Tanacetum coccineum TaxID=301880 RepID=A0ABQ5CVB5_9ASTR